MVQTHPVLRASVTSAATALNPGDPAPILVDGADTPITANGLGGYTPMPGDRLLVQQVGGLVEVMQFVSTGAVPNVATFRQATAPSTATTPLYAIWYDTSNSNRPNRLEPDPVTGAPTWVTLTIDSSAMDIANVRANTVEKGFVLGGGGVGVLSAGATNPTTGPVISNYWPQFNTQMYNAGNDQSIFFAGAAPHPTDNTKFVVASIFFGTAIRTLNKADGSLGAFDPNPAPSWSSQFYAWGGISYDGANYWLLGSDNDRSSDVYLYCISGTDFKTKLGELRIGSSTAFNGFFPRLASTDGAAQAGCAGMLWVPLSGKLMLRWYAVSGGTVVQIGSDVTLLSSVTGGQTDLGGGAMGDAGGGLGVQTLWVAFRTNGTNYPNVMAWTIPNFTSATRQSSLDFKKPSGNSIQSMMLDKVTGHFLCIDKTAVMRVTSNLAISGSTSVTARTTFYDGDTGNYAGTVGSGTVVINGVDVSGTASTAHETGYSPTVTFTTSRRAWVRLTSPVHAPDETNLDSTKVDRANKIGFYVAIGGGTMWRQAYGTVGQTVVDSFDTFPTTGTPDVHTFATAQVALGVFESASTRLDGTPKFYVDGSGGTANMDGLLPPASIIMSAKGAIPPGWLLCNGSAVSRTTFADLFAVIGTTYGVGDGSTTFNIPNLVNKFPRGGSSPGATGGQDTLPDHTHGAGTYGNSSTSLTNQTNTTTGGTATRVTDLSHSHGFSGNSGIVIGTNPSILPSYLTLVYLIKT